MPYIDTTKIVTLISHVIAYIMLQLGNEYYHKTGSYIRLKRRSEDFPHGLSHNQQHRLCKYSVKVKMTHEYQSYFQM